MTAPNMQEQEEELQNQQGEENEAPIEQQEQQPVQQQRPSIDVNALYMDSIRQRQELERRLEAMEAQQQQQRQTPQNSEPELTDADIEKYGTVGTIRRVVENVISNTLPKHLQQSLGDIPEVSRQFKRNQQVDLAEQQFFQNFPALAQTPEIRQGLAQTVRQALGNTPNVDPQTYAEKAWAAIGYLQTMSMMNGGGQNQQQPQNTQPQNVPRNTPQSRVNGAPTRQNTVRLSELERRTMRKYGLDPDKAEDVKSFLDEINNEDGITVHMKY